MHARAVLGAILLAVLAVGTVRASASALGPVGTPGVASADQLVVSPPVVVSAIDWEPEFESVPLPAEFRVRVLRIQFTFTTDFVGPLLVKFTVTGASPLPKEHYQITGNLDKLAGETETFEFGMDSLNVPVAAVQDLHIMVCDHHPADGNTRCRLP